MRYEVSAGLLCERHKQIIGERFKIFTISVEKERPIKRPSIFESVDRVK